MNAFPQISGREVVKVGYEKDRQKSSHIVLRQGDPHGRLVVPDYREIPKDTLRKIVK